MEVKNNLEELLKKAVDFFRSEFGLIPKFAGYGPGRVNLIGEHTDYNDGFVLPIALNLATLVVGSANNSDKCRVRTCLQLEEEASAEFMIPSKQKLTPGNPQWANYIKGVVANFKGEVQGFDAVVVTSVPLGGGLSSSASLEVATYTFLEGLFGKTTSPTDKALACQRAEHEFANTPCGIMDQFISVLGERNSALLIDCLELTSKLIPMHMTDHVIVITNSNVKHSLGSGEYGVRRSQCEEAAKKLGVKSLRYATLDMLLAKRTELPDVIFRRARHVVTEIERTKAAAEALPAGDLIKFGQLMYQSHESLRHDYAVSCPELDELVAAAREVEGVLGSRMTGGGFGGCTVTLVHKDALESLKANIETKYSSTPTFYTAVPSHGARLVDLGL
ncbi:galactokinase-like [Macrosteles quadrilineatus]|uniref:galactokinase-like n=1 Tax=Macrosteles quadrilineatus TaxID=74068 RepID=UPI0023E33A70|nr:galactokinase-like [Macrosteles quadrilineatus]